MPGSTADARHATRGFGAGPTRRPETRIDIPGHEWHRDVDRTHRRIDRILRRTPARAGAPQSSRNYVAIHG